MWDKVELVIRHIRHYVTYLVFIGLLIVSSLLIVGKISFSTSIGNTNIGVNQQILTGLKLGDFQLETGINYQFTIIEKSENSDNNVSDWLTFLSILSTLLAAFFIYSSRKIDNDLKKIEEKYQSVNEDLKAKMYTIEDEIRMSTIISKANMYLSTKRLDEAKSLLKDEIENQSTQENGNGYLYTLYKTLADIYRIQGESEMEKQESSDHQDYYFNAIQNLEEAMKIKKGKEDDELLASYTDRYDVVKAIVSQQE